jgi:hypothetical protein
MRLKRSCLCGDRSLPRRRPPCVSSTVFGAGSLAGTGNFVSLSHPGRDRATPTTPVEIDGATQVWHLSAHCAQFRAPAFPSSVPCRSRCRAPAGLARARTSDDIRPRALGTPPPKSFAPTPYIRPMLPQASGVVSMVSRPGCTSGPIVAFAPQHTWRAAGPHAQGKSMRYELRAINFHLGKTPPREPQGGMERTGCAAA